MVAMKWIEQEVQEELARVSRRLTSLKHESRPEELEAGGDNTPLSEAADVAAVVAERELQDEHVHRLQERAVHLEHALERVRDGSYGWCATCGRPIDTRRLEVLPEVETCLQCAEL